MNFQLLSAIQQITTNNEKINTDMRTSFNSQFGCNCAVFFAKTSLNVSPVVTVLFMESDKLEIRTIVPVDFNPLNGAYSNDYLHFQKFANRVFSPEEFIKINQEFWQSQGFLGLDSLF